MNMREDKTANKIKRAKRVSKFVKHSTLDDQRNLGIMQNPVNSTASEQVNLMHLSPACSPDGTQTSIMEH